MQAQTATLLSLALASARPEIFTGGPLDYRLGHVPLRELLSAAAVPSSSWLDEEKRLRLSSTQVDAFFGQRDDDDDDDHHAVFADAQTLSVYGPDDYDDGSYSSVGANALAAVLALCRNVTTLELDRCEVRGAGGGGAEIPPLLREVRLCDTPLRLRTRTFLNTLLLPPDADTEKEKKKLVLTIFVHLAAQDKTWRLDMGDVRARIFGEDWTQRTLPSAFSHTKVHVRSHFMEDRFIAEMISHTLDTSDWDYDMLMSFENFKEQNRVDMILKEKRDGENPKFGIRFRLWKFPA